MSTGTEPHIVAIEHIKDVLQCCLLCSDTRKLLHKIIDHAKTYHNEAISTLKSLNKCKCSDIEKLKAELINHLLAAILPKIDETPQTDDENSKNQVKNPEGKDHEKSLPPKEKPPKPVKDITIASKPTEDPQFACEFCPKVLFTRSGLSKHVDTMHNPSNGYKCPKCADGHCNTLKNLYAHMKVHDTLEISEKKCSSCGKTFDSEKQLYHHMLLHRERLLECAHCGLRFNMKQPLLKHIFTHFGVRKKRQPEPRRLCEVCSQLVPSSRMKRHLAAHFGDSSGAYKCTHDGCGKFFTELRNLRDHQNTHLDLKPYVCEFCGMGFRQRAAVRQHRLRHTEPERYKCDTCGECFVTAQSLRKHRTRQHINGDIDVRPFACEFEGCASTFRYEDALMRHRKEVHSRKPDAEIKCDSCSYVTKSHKNFFQHMRRTHKIKRRLNNRVFPSTPVTAVTPDEN